jgi:regulatory protein
MMKATHKSQQPADQGNPWPTILRLLTGRDYSHAELRQRLLDRGFESTRIDEALQRCLELGYLDDARYAFNRAISLMNQGRAVGPRVLADLRRHGISPEIANQALEKSLESCDENQLFRSLMDRRFPDFDYDSASFKERRRVVQYLQRRGYPLSLIMDQLTRKGLTEHDEDR